MMLAGNLTKSKSMKALNPPSLAPPLARYSHGVEIPPGARMVRTSGQLAMTASGDIPSGAEAQAALIFSNIDAILAQADMTRTNVIHVSAFVTDRAHMAGYMAARDTWLDSVTPLPSSTLMIVSGFTRPEFVVEIEVWAAG